MEEGVRVIKMRFLDLVFKIHRRKRRRRRNTKKKKRKEEVKEESR